MVKILTALAVAVALVLGGVAVYKANDVKKAVSELSLKTIKGEKGDKGDRGLQGLPGKDGKDATSLGAVASNIIYSNSLTVNGLRTFYYARPFIAATTTVCAFQSPAATSTLVNGSASFRISSTTATAITISRSSTAFATTTGVLATTTIAANAQASLNALATSTAASYDNKIIVDSRTFSPNQWFVVGMQGGIGTFSPTGLCTAEFREIQ